MSRQFLPHDTDLVAALWESGEAHVQHKSDARDFGALIRPILTSAIAVGSAVVGWQLAESKLAFLETELQLAAKAAVVLAALAVLWMELGFHTSPRRLASTSLSLSSAVGADGPKSGAPRKNGRLPGQLLTLPANVPQDTTATIPAIFAAAKAQNSGDLLGQRRVLLAKREGRFVKYAQGNYNWMTWEETAQRALDIGSGLVRRCGVEPGDSRIMVYANTSRDWMTTFLGCAHFNVQVCTAYATLGLDALAYTIDQTESRVLVCDLSLLPKLVEIMEGRKIENPSGGEVQCDLSHVDTIVTFEDPASREEQNHDRALEAKGALNKRSRAHGGPVEVVALEDVIAAGADNPVQPSLPAPEDTAVVMYTSGSTSLPKGVIVSHGNLVAAVAGLGSAIPKVGPQDVYIAYLPLSHILEMAAELTLLVGGARLGYSSPFTLSDASPAILKGTPEENPGDAVVLRPTVMAGVPAVFDKVRAGIEAVVSKSAVKSFLFNLAMFYKQRAVAAGASAPFWDNLLFYSIRQRLGGRMRMIVTGGGPLSGATQRFVESAFCCVTRQGYGLTETCGCGTVGWAMDFAPARVGAPTGSNLVKLEDWDEYTTTSTPERPRPEGEIILGGPCITQGYFKNEEKTKAEFRVDADGTRWFATGDIGRWDEDGVLRIIDRKKDLVKLSKGEYVSLGKVESILKGVGLLENVCVYADSTQDFCVAVVVPNPVTVRDTLKIEGTREELAASDELRAKLLDAVKAHAKSSGLHRSETPGKITLSGFEWTPENDMLTASMKLRRRQITKRFQADFDALYAK